MEFWGVEVKPGQTLRVRPGLNKLLHLSQASLGEPMKGKGNESVTVFLRIDYEKLVIGTLSAEKCSHTTHDLVMQKAFELSHNWTDGSVYFCGYKVVYQDFTSATLSSDEDSSDSESDPEEDIPLVADGNGIPEQTDAPSKPSTNKVNVVEPIKEETVKEENTESDDDKDDSGVSAKDESDNEKMADLSGDEEDDSSDGEDKEGSSDDEVKEGSSDDEDNEGSSDDEDNEGSSDDEDEDGSSDEEEETTPKKAEQNKKRPIPAESGTKTPIVKKAKFATPQKTGGEVKKTGGHIATPYPSKQTSKSSSNNEKSKQQTPVSDVQVNCGSCSRSFKSNQALESHSKAKHSAAK